jgi:hypothetical protein
LSAPKEITFIVAVIVAVIGVLSALIMIPVLTGFALWIVVIGFIILAVGCLVTGA